MSNRHQRQTPPQQFRAVGRAIGLALGGFVIWSGLKLKLGTINDPGPGFVLFYTGILMCLFAASIIIGALTEGGPSLGSRWVDTRWTKSLLVIVCLIAFSFALNPLGFLLSSIPLMLLLLRLVNPVRWPWPFRLPCWPRSACGGSSNACS